MLFVVALAFCEIVNVVPERIAVITEFSGIAEPLTNCPTTRPAVLPVVSVALALVVLTLKLLRAGAAANELLALMLIGATPPMFGVAPKLTDPPKVL